MPSFRINQHQNRGWMIMGNVPGLNMFDIKKPKGFIKSQALGEVTGCEDDFVCLYVLTL